jgi:2-hydroxycyclohexanecarboxyl-CoA dehydrogenase
VSDLKGRVAIVTGGGQGIGKAITLRLAAEGCKVAVFDLQPAAAEATAQEARAKGGEAKVYEVDISDQAAVNEGVQRAEADLGPTWLLVNNAGWDKPAPFLQTEKPLWDKIIAINLNGPLYMHKAVLPGMVSRNGGRVVNIASDAARVGTSTEAVYSACKGGMIAFTKSLARELARNNVLLNCVCPGPTNTPMMQSVLGQGEQAEKWKDAMVRGIPLKRMGEPEDYAGIVAFLGTADAAYITGQAISVSGGMNMV